MLQFRHLAHSIIAHQTDQGVIDLDRVSSVGRSKTPRSDGIGGLSQPQDHGRRIAEARADASVNRALRPEFGWDLRKSHLNWNQIPTDASGLISRFGRGAKNCLISTKAAARILRWGAGRERQRPLANLCRAAKQLRGMELAHQGHARGDH